MDDNIPKDNTKILDEILSDEEKKEAFIAQVQEENPFLKSVNSVNNQALDMVIESDKLPKDGLDSQGSGNPSLEHNCQLIDLEHAQACFFTGTDICNRIAYDNRKTMCFRV